jgi:acetyl-CoA synthetase
MIPPHNSVAEMALDYASYDEAVEKFSWDERWELFDGTPSNFNIAHECIDRYDDEMTAARVKFDDGHSETYSIGTLRRKSGQFANALENHGIEKGDRVAVMLNPGLELYTSLFGNCKRGAVHVQLSPLFGPDAINYRIEDSEAKLLVTTPEKAKDIPDSVNVDTLLVGDEFDDFVKGEPVEFDWDTEANDVSVLQYTSGTTGRPTGHEMLHKTASFVAVRMKFAYGIRSGGRYFCTSSPSWAHGLWMGTIGPLALGNAVGAYSGAFDVDTVLDALEEFEIANFAAAATALRKIINHSSVDSYDLKLKRVGTAGEKIDEGTQTQLREQLGVTVADIYGVSEFGGFIMNYNGFDDWEIKPGSIGKPFPGFEVTVLNDNGTELPPGEVGEIAVKRDGEWFRVGDLGSVDEDDYYWYKSRKDDVIISSGYRIDPLEVEEALLKHDEVLEAAVVGKSHEERGKVVTAFVKTSAEASDELREDIQETVKADLSKHEYPRRLEFVDQFPRTADGTKIKRNKL